jgi:cbb3-type cytochrome c oxidase subunit III
MMKNVVIGLLMAVGISSAVQAAGNPEAGKTKAMVCGGCHGVDGNSAAGMFPKLAGQGERYLIKQIHDIKSGARNVPQMTGILTSLSDQDIQDIAAYFHSQKRTGGQAKKDLVAKGETIYRAGNQAVGIPACAACHGATGAGLQEAGFPALSGQHPEYIVTQLKNFRSGARANDGDTRIMRDVTARMRDDEIDAVASFVSGLHK